MIAFPDLTTGMIIAASLVTCFGAFTKGVSGFALPMIMVSGMALFLDPRLAIAAIVIPTFIANLWQAVRHGWRAALDALREFRLLIGTTLVMIYIHAQWIGNLPLERLLALLGASIALISLVQLIGFQLILRPGLHRLGAFITGQIAGFFGAISGTWGPPTIIYLLAIDTEKTLQTRVAGISFGLGALMFAIGHRRSGIISAEALGLSLFLLLPMAIGLYFGARAQAKIDQALFRKITLLILLFAGANLLRKALMG